MPREREGSEGNWGLITGREGGEARTWMGGQVDGPATGRGDCTDDGKGAQEVGG